MSNQTSKQTKRTSKTQQRRKSRKRNQSYAVPAKNKDDFNQQLDWFFDDESIFSNRKLHGNTKWQPAELARQALIFSWSEKDCVTDGFEEFLKRCQKLKIPVAVKTYQGFMGALASTRQRFIPQLCSLLQQKTKALAGNERTKYGFTPIAFDGSRNSAPRTESNEVAFCAANYGQGKTAKYRKKKTQGMRRTQNEKNKPAAPAPQVWITMMWHMSLRLPWS